jgi:hypothetical protein
VNWNAVDAFLNIFEARPADYKPAEIHVYDAPLASQIDLPVVVTP